jgi:hypothetical protein
VGELLQILIRYHLGAVFKITLISLFVLASFQFAATAWSGEFDGNWEADVTVETHNGRVFEHKGSVTILNNTFDSKVYDEQYKYSFIAGEIGSSGKIREGYFMWGNESWSIPIKSGKFTSKAATLNGAQFQNFLTIKMRRVSSHTANDSAASLSTSTGSTYCRRADDSIYTQPSRANCPAGSKFIDGTFLPMTMVVDGPGGKRAQISGLVRYKGDYGADIAAWIYNGNGRKVCDGSYSLDQSSDKGRFVFSCFDDQRNASGELSVSDPFTLEMVISGDGHFDDGSEFRFISGLHSRNFERRRADLLE